MKGLHLNEAVSAHSLFRQCLFFTLLHVLLACSFQRTVQESAKRIDIRQRKHQEAEHLRK